MSGKSASSSSSLSSASPVSVQAGCIPLWEGRIILVTTKKGKRWVFPKGSVKPNENAAEAAQRETEEEAGLTGTLNPIPLGIFADEKGGLPHEIYILHVSQIHRKFEEGGLRQRRALTIAEALQLPIRSHVREAITALCQFSVNCICKIAADSSSSSAPFGNEPRPRIAIGLPEGTKAVPHLRNDD